MLHFEVSIDGGTPKSSILMGFSMKLTNQFGVPPFLETPIWHPEDVGFPANGRPPGNSLKLQTGREAPGRRDFLLPFLGSFIPQKRTNLDMAAWQSNKVYSLHSSDLTKRPDNSMRDQCKSTLCRAIPGSYCNPVSELVMLLN